MKNCIKSFLRIIAVLIFTGQFETLNAQDTNADNEDSNIYRPYSQRMRMEDDSVAAVDSFFSVASAEQDSIDTRIRFVQDSIAKREQFIHDSLLVRAQFVRDSLLRRKQILDSVIFLRTELPNLLNATINTVNDDIIISTSKINIEGDSILSDYSYVMLPTRFSDPYTPWKSTLNLSSKPPVFEIDSKGKLITSIKAPGMNNIFNYSADKKIVSISRQGMFTSKYSKKYYKAPIDSVFFDNNGRILKVKRYYMFYQATENFQKGAFLFNFLWQVKLYSYNGNDLGTFEIVKFCERWAKSDPEKVCNKSKYAIEKQGFSYVLIRSNDPANAFSDGTYKYEFDNLYNLKNVTFRNNTNSENWKTFIELNADGNVSRYVYQDKGIVNRTMLVNYYLNDPKAKHKVETITCTFEDDGISYFQHNNTTEKSRVRDHFTGEWEPWK